jgi:hypothetical protein
MRYYSHHSPSSLSLDTQSTSFQFSNNFHHIDIRNRNTMGCGSSKSQGLDNNKLAQPVTYTTAPPPNNTAVIQSPVVQQPAEKKRKRKAATNLGLLSTLVN